MSDRTVRITPPSTQANNQDVFIWALYLLGGADTDVDVEDVYLKSFELAPARLGWRTQPHIPDYKKTSKALQSVEANTHVGLVHKVGKYTRRLTADGAAWVERYKNILASTYSSVEHVPLARNSQNERLRRALRTSRAFDEWTKGQSFTLEQLADALDCNPASSQKVWAGRLDGIRRAADVSSDEMLRDFAYAAAEFLEKRLKGWK